ncbi:MAG TPA: hypothetical protein VM840_10310 [Actinomycetota bacterium]|nr:hypothetical protein [Actinomycetota bacterium]
MKRALAWLLVALFAVASPTAALAHGQRDVDGRRFVLGWLNEPAYVEQPNAVQMIVRDGSGRPIEDLADSLTVEVRFGDRSSGPLRFEPAFGSPGEYHAAIVPTQPGRYAFHVTGTIDGQRIDVEMEAGPDTFDEVGTLGEIQFPDPLPGAGEQATRVERVDARVRALQDELDSSRAQAKVALGAAAVAGVIALAALALALSRRRRT